MADVSRTLLEALRFFVHRDHMNAAMHCGDVRDSPLTFRMAEAYAAVTEGEQVPADVYVREVLLDLGQYEEDRGR